MTTLPQPWPRRQQVLFAYAMEIVFFLAFFGLAHVMQKERIAFFLPACAFLVFLIPPIVHKIARRRAGVPPEGPAADDPTATTLISAREPELARP